MVEPQQNVEQRVKTKNQSAIRPPESQKPWIAQGRSLEDLHQKTIAVDSIKVFESFNRAPTISFWSKDTMYYVSAPSKNDGGRYRAFVAKIESDATKTIGLKKRPDSDNRIYRFASPVEAEVLTENASSSTVHGVLRVNFSGAVKAPEAPLLKEAQDVRGILKAAPGNDEFDTRFSWNQAHRDKDGMVRIPGVNGGVDLLVGSYRQVQKVCDADVFGCQIPEKNAVAIPKPAQAFVAMAMGKADASSRFFNAIAPDPDFTKAEYPSKLKNKDQRAVWFEGLLVHELHHASGAGNERSELGAYRAQSDYFTKSKLTGLVASDVVSEDGILTSYLLGRSRAPLEFGANVAERFGGKLSAEALSWLPGGARFLSLVENAATTAKQMFGKRTPPKEVRELLDSLNSYLDPSSDFRREIADGWSWYAAQQALAEYRKQNSLNPSQTADILFPKERGIDPQTEKGREIYRRNIEVSHLMVEADYRAAADLTAAIAKQITTREPR